MKTKERFKRRHEIIEQRQWKLGRIVTRSRRLMLQAVVI